MRSSTGDFPSVLVYAPTVGGLSITLDRTETTQQSDPLFSFSPWFRCWRTQVGFKPELSVCLALRQILLWIWFPAVMLHQTGPPSLTHALRTAGRSYRLCRKQAQIRACKIFIQTFLCWHFSIFIPPQTVFQLVEFIQQSTNGSVLNTHLPSVTTAYQTEVLLITHFKKELCN